LYTIVKKFNIIMVKSIMIKSDASTTNRKNDIKKYLDKYFPN